MKTCFVTTFSEELYELSGERMLLSFLAKQPYDILICYEGKQPAPQSDRITYHDLTENFFLEKWLRDNADIIPEEYGGKCKLDLDVNIKKIYGSNFNSRASQFFRKVVAVSESLYPKPMADFFVFVDCDCIFLQRIPEHFLEGLAKYHLTYHLGKFRREISKQGVESGVFTYLPTSEIIHNWIRTYADRSFRESIRWDDGFCLRNELEAYDGSNKNIDLVEFYDKPTSGVVEYGPWRSYIRHEKGYHANTLNL